jgi:hypothetical protein
MFFSIINGLTIEVLILFKVEEARDVFYCESDGSVEV